MNQNFCRIASSHKGASNKSLNCSFTSYEWQLSGTWTVITGWCCKGKPTDLLADCRPLWRGAGLLFGSLDFNSCRELLKCQYLFYRLCVHINRASSLVWLQELSSPVQDQDGLFPWTVAAGPMLPVFFSFSVLSLHPNCCFLKAQTNCVFRLRLIRQEPTKHLNGQIPFNLPEPQESDLSSCVLCKKEKQSPRQWLEFWDGPCNKCA